MPKAKKNLYAVAGDGTRYVLAESFPDAEKAWWRLIKKTYGKDVDNMAISSIALLAEADEIG